MDNNLTIKRMPAELRPRERLAREGVQALTNAELIAILLRTGTAKDNALDLAMVLLNRFGSLKQLMEASVEELSETKGIGLAKAAQLKAAFEMSKRVSLSGGSLLKILSPDDLASVVMEEMCHLDREYFKAVLLNIKNQIISIETISVGLLNSSLVHPRELFKVCIKRSAHSIMLMHNHPSGDPKPSKEDVLLTRRIKAAGEIIGIEVLDHLIFGGNSFISMKESGLC